MPLSRRAPQDLNFPLVDADALLNLRAFVKKCILPDLDHSYYDGPFYKTRVDPQKYPNSLQIRPESWRLLELMHPIPSHWPSRWLLWLDTYVPSTPVKSVATHIRPRIDARVTLRNELPQLYAYKPGKITSQIAWVDLALVTATQIIHHSFPGLRDCVFVERRNNTSIDFDEKIFAEFLWCRAQRRPQDDEKKATLVVAIQPHWVLDEHDMDQFVRCTAYPTFSGEMNPSESEINNKYKIWSKIWDACVRAKAHRFVLSNYKQWVFGGFSKGYKVGFVSSIYPYNNPSPTIVELLTYWIAASVPLAGTYKLPQVLEPFFYGTIQMGIPSNALGCNVKSDVAWGQTNGGQFALYFMTAHMLSVAAELREAEEECDTQSQWSDEGSVASEFEPHDTDRQEIVQGWVMDQASDGHEERSYPNPVVKRSFHFAEPMLEEVCGDWLM